MKQQIMQAHMAKAFEPISIMPRLSRREGAEHDGREAGGTLGRHTAGRSLTDARFGHDFSRVPSHTEQSFPHREGLERGFGMMIPGRVVIDAAECGRRGVPAFTDNMVTYFASERPNLKVAAHEAAHLVQHAGLTGDAHLGAEAHADAVARSVARGDSARGLFGAGGSRPAPAVRHYTEIPAALQTPSNWPAGARVRVSEDGRMAVKQDTAKHTFWAEPTAISESNSILTSRKSVIRLGAMGESIQGPAPVGGTTRTLSRVKPSNVATSTSGESMNIWADCGRSGRDVMGAGRGTGGGAMEGVYKETKRAWWTKIPLLGPLLGLIFGDTISSEKETSASGDPEAMKYEIFNAKLGGTGDEGFKKYQALSADEKDKFDKEAGINRYAAPTTGEGYTMSTGGATIPGMEADTWNFHWGGVVMNSGEDSVTLENYAVGDASVQNSDWEFQMYGPASKPGQTFHDQHKATEQHGDAPTTMHVREG